MTRIARILSAPVLALVLPAAALAQQLSGTHASSNPSAVPRNSSEEHDLDEGLHFSHPIFTESISPDRKIRANGSSDFTSNGQAWETALEGEWIFHRSFSIEVTVPYVVLVPDEGDTSDGLGNAEVAFKFANYAFEEAGVLLGYGIEVGLPTGDEGQGTGSDNLWEFEPFLNAGYQHGSLEAVGWIRFGVPTNQGEDEEVETDFHYDLSLLYELNPRIQGLLELNGSAVASGDEAGDGAAYLGPGVKFAPFPTAHSLFVGLGIELPLHGDEADARVRASLFYHF